MRKTILLFLPAVALAKAGRVLLTLTLLSPLTLIAQQNYYSVKFPDDGIIVSCGGTADTLWPVITYYGNCSYNVGVSVKDQVFNLNNTGTCKKILRPSFDTLPLLGVNTLDVMLVEQHITGQALLANPYRIIAADVNRDGQLNAADLDAMNNLIVGTASTFPGNKSWRFVPSAYVFPNQAQPLLTAFPEKITTVCPAPSGLNQHFTAIKTGDVNGSALTSSRGENWVVFTAKKQRFIAGELVEVHIQSPDLSNVAGFQFTLEADTAFLTLQSVAAGTIPTRFGISLEQNRVAASWYSIEPVEGEQTVFVLKFMALKSGTVSQSLQMNSLIAQPEAYDHNLNSAYAVLKFDSFFFPAASRGNHTHLARFERQGNSNTQRLF